ncbi:hypothetical protein [Candidatus Methylacidithermus pantelleriae]|uniref:DUF4032 domain-containing protein n=1 Tax=Candidatus Methylacidithermus pantelleriae TaxID=2744239 RepID=A0A8J2FMS1_9BACT|nr:hypothetical protein [Candidatus Methylacidithermus pantelleriae]CAF0689687.1 hypothetical protein MPNT_10317 [Candidatus Methylacidithermus pantelleriae]
MENSSSCSNRGQAGECSRLEKFFEQSTLYQEFLAEREEILRHKWIESEKAGRDIGFEKALLDWILNHRAAWRAYRKRLREGKENQRPGQAALLVTLALCLGPKV